MVRHGRAAARWDEDPDPTLDEEGALQAEHMAAALAPAGPLTLLASPLRRTRATAAALERAWSVTARVEPRVGEIPSPGLPLAQRGAWLAGVLAGAWEDQPAVLHQWRRGVVEALLGLESDAVVVTHFVAINAAVGHATGDRRVTCFRPGYCSTTVLDSSGGTLTVVQRGSEAETVVR